MVVRTDPEHSVEGERNNPYQTPSTLPATPTVSESVVSRIITWTIPSLLTIGCTLVLWLASASVLGRLVNGDNVMYFWSGSLMISSGLATYLMNRLWPRRLQALAMAAGFVIFGIVFCMLEGDTSNGTDRFQMFMLYGTLSVLPFMAFGITRVLSRNRVQSLIEGN